jgi:hypothetical protein
LAVFSGIDRFGLDPVALLLPPPVDFIFEWCLFGIAANLHYGAGDVLREFVPKQLLELRRGLRGDFVHRDDARPRLGHQVTCEPQMKRQFT